jgi:hypothetical protein
MNFTRTYSLNSTPPLGGPNTTATDVVGPVTMTAQNEGVLDIPSGSATGAAFSIPFGSVGSPQHVFVQNAGMSGTIKVGINGGTGASQVMELPPGGSVEYTAPVAVAEPPTVIAVFVGATEPGLGQVKYVIYGN